MYNQRSLKRLEGKVEYELWYLKYIAKTQDIFEGSEELTSIEFNHENIDKVNVFIQITEVVGINHAMKVIESIRPLTFVSAYKIIDMIFEWILEENTSKGNIKKVPWQFCEKIKMIKNKKLQHPQLIQINPYLGIYLFSLYEHLTKFRNEIIHNNHFSIIDQRLRIDTVYKGIEYKLEMDKIHMGSFVRVAIAYANLLIGKIQYGYKEENLIKYNLDMLSKLHQLTIFNEKIQLEIEVIYNIQSQEGIFMIDLMQIRKKIKQIYPGSDIIYSLKIIGYEDKKQTDIWKIPANHVPNSNKLILPNSNFSAYKDNNDNKKR